VRRVDDDKEFVIPADRPVVSLEELTGEDPRVASRGAAHEAFNLVFSLPFGSADVEGFEDPANAWLARPTPPPAAPEVLPLTTHGLGARRLGGLVTMGAGAIGLGFGVGFSLRATHEKDVASPSDSQRGAASRNDRIKNYDLGAGISYAAGGAALATGLLLFFWPEAPHVNARVSAGRVDFGYTKSF
jgi:hypothetical protein